MRDAMYASPGKALQALGKRLEYVEAKITEKRQLNQPWSYLTDEAAAIRTAIREVEKVRGIPCHERLMYGAGI